MYSIFSVVEAILTILRIDARDAATTVHTANSILP